MQSDTHAWRFSNPNWRNEFSDTDKLVILDIETLAHQVRNRLLSEPVALLVESRHGRIVASEGYNLRREPMHCGEGAFELTMADVTHAGFENEKIRVVSSLKQPPSPSSDFTAAIVTFEWP